MGLGFGVFGFRVWGLGYWCIEGFWGWGWVGVLEVQGLGLSGSYGFHNVLFYELGFCQLGFGASVHRLRK